MTGKTLDLKEVLAGDGIDLSFAAASFTLPDGQRHVVPCQTEGDRKLLERAVWAFAIARDARRAACEATDAIHDFWHSTSRQAREALHVAMRAVRAGSGAPEGVAIQTWDAIPANAVSPR